MYSSVFGEEWGYWDASFARRFVRIAELVREITGGLFVSESDLQKAFDDHRPSARETSRFAFWVVVEYSLNEHDRQFTTWKRFRSIPFGYLESIFLVKDAPVFYENAYTLARAAYLLKVPAEWVREFLAENHDWMYYEYDRMAVEFCAHAAARGATPDEVRRLENEVYPYTQLNYRNILKILSKDVPPVWLCDLALSYEGEYMPFNVSQIVAGFHAGLPKEYMMALEEESDGTA